mgnify:CR=1 FL=1
MMRRCAIANPRDRHSLRGRRFRGRGPAESFSSSGGPFGAESLSGECTPRSTSTKQTRRSKSSVDLPGVDAIGPSA